MLINLSNHPYSGWSHEQKKRAAEFFGTVTDLAFPAVDPKASTRQVKQLVQEYFQRITAIFDACANEPKANAVHIQGEFTFVCNLVASLKSSDITCVASTTKREVTEKENGEKIVKFNFVQFREY